MLRGPQPFKQGINKPKTIPPPESNTWWWHPSRPGVPSGPLHVRNKLQAMDPLIDLTLNRYTGNYQVWMSKPTIKSKVCWGWQLLFIVAPQDLGEGDLILARLYEASARKWGGAKQYFAAIEREMAREKEMRDKKSLQDSIDQSMEIFNHSQISVAMRGASNGSKWSTYMS